MNGYCVIKANTIMSLLQILLQIPTVFRIKSKTQLPLGPLPHSHLQPHWFPCCSPNTLSNIRPEGWRQVVSQAQKVSAPTLSDECLLTCHNSVYVSLPPGDLP